MRIAFFDAKPYDRPAFDKFGKASGISFKYFETKLNEDTAELASGFDGVCAFVNDTLSAAVIDRLHAMGVKLIAMRFCDTLACHSERSDSRVILSEVRRDSTYALLDALRVRFRSLHSE